MIKFSLDPREKYAVIETCHLDAIREHFSVENIAARHAKRYNPHIPSRLYAITPGGRFDPPLFYEIYKFLLSRNITEPIERTPEFNRAIAPSPNWKLDPTISLSLPLRDYQSVLVDTCLKSGRGTVILATAGGKTLAIATLTANIIKQLSSFKKALIVVPDLGLVEQTFKDFLEYKVPFSCSRWTGSQPLDLSAQVVIANAGILQSAAQDIAWTKYVDLVIVDEVHKLRKNNAIVDFVKNIRTPFKFGFTGTMPESKIDQWNIIGKIGPVIYEKGSAALRKESYISKVKVQILKIVYKTPFLNISGPEAYRNEVNFSINNEYRNKTIATLAQNTKNNTLILVDRIEHGLVLLKLISDSIKDKQVWFIRGEVEVEDRQKVQQYMENNTNAVVIAISKVFSTGINIKNLHFIIFASGGKAKVKIIQSIGRGLRLHEQKEQLLIIDIADQLTYGIQHADRREKLYAAEQIPFQTKSLYEP